MLQVCYGWCSVDRRLDLLGVIHGVHSPLLLLLLLFLLILLVCYKRSLLHSSGVGEAETLVELFVLDLSDIVRVAGVRRKHRSWHAGGDARESTVVVSVGG